jgi:hypothetical protein
MKYHEAINRPNGKL